MDNPDLKRYVVAGVVGSVVGFTFSQVFDKFVLAKACSCECCSGREKCECTCCAPKAKI